jgi:hypothetical protein
MCLPSLGCDEHKTGVYVLANKMPIACIFMLYNLDLVNITLLRPGDYVKTGLSFSMLESAFDSEDLVTSLGIIQLSTGMICQESLTSRLPPGTP